MSGDPDDIPPTPSEGSAEEPLPLVELELLLTRPPSRRKRLAYVSLVLVVVVVALVTFQHTLFPQPALPQPTPTLPLALRSPAVLVQSNVTFGAITINGHKQAGTPPLFTPLKGETYDLTLTAPPFRTVSCHVKSPQPPASGTLVSFSQAGQCTALRYRASSGAGFQFLHGIYADPTLVLMINVLAGDLPLAQQRQVTTLLTQALTTQQETSVPAGEETATGVAADGTITSQLTSEPLQAQAGLAPSTAFLPQANFCGALLCPATLNPYVLASSATLPSRPLWAVEVPMAVRWQFTNASGQVSAAVAFPASSVITLFLEQDGKGGWQIDQQEVVPGASPIREQLASSFCWAGMFFFLLRPAAKRMGVSPLHDQGIAGCELSIQQSPANPSQPSITLRNLVWRFGVLLAADAQAHANFPDLPMASGEAIAAVGG